MTNYNSAIVALQKFAESRDLRISLQYKKSEFIEDWLKESDRVWEEDFNFLLASSENLSSEISNELIFFTEKFNSKTWEPESMLLSPNITDNVPVRDDFFEEESQTYPFHRIDVFGVKWEIKNSNFNKLFDHFVRRQRCLEKVIIFKEEILKNIEYYKEKEGAPPFTPIYSNINKIPTLGSINKTAGIFALLIRHSFLLVKDNEKKGSDKKKFTPDQLKKFTLKLFRKINLLISYPICFSI